MAITEQEKDLVKDIHGLSDEETRVLKLAADAIISGGEASERVSRCKVWLKSPECEKTSHSDTLKVVEAIATGNLDILPDHLVVSIRDHVFCMARSAV